MGRTFGKIILALTLLSPTTLALAQTSDIFTSAYNVGILSSDRFSGDCDVFILQPATLPHINSLQFSSQIQSRYSGFNVFAMGFHAATALPMKFGAGLSILSLGHPDYKSSSIVASLGKQLSQYTSIGISQRIQKTKIATEGRPWTGSTNIGVMYDHERWGLGVYLNGLMRWNKTFDPEDFAVQASAYFQWTRQTRMYFLLNYADEFIQPVTGIRQILIENIAVFGAFQLNPARYGLGFLIPLNDQLEFIFSTQYHTVLGWSPSIGLQWRKRGKVKGEKSW